MCFGQGQSFAFAATGFALAGWLYRKDFKGLASSVGFFGLMEFLQGVQYSSFIINQCDNPVNKVLTIVGFAHICLQPYFTHLMNKSLTRNPKTRDKYDVILPMCLAGGALIFARYLMSPFTHDLANFTDQCAGTKEWLRASPEDGVCTYSGLRHLAWRVPMYEPTYFAQGTGLHSFLMFMPFFIVNVKANFFPGVFLFVTGPLLASYISPNLQEQASIWCFGSIMQICVMLFMIRKTLMSGKTRQHYEGGFTAKKRAVYEKEA